MDITAGYPNWTLPADHPNTDPCSRLPFPATLITRSSLPPSLLQPTAPPPIYLFDNEPAFVSASCHLVTTTQTMPRSPRQRRRSPSASSSRPSTTSASRASSTSWLSTSLVTVVALIFCLYPTASFAILGAQCNFSDNQSYVNFVYQDPCGDRLEACWREYAARITFPPNDLDAFSIPHATPANNTCAYKTCSNSDYQGNWTNLTSYPTPRRCPSNTSFCPDSGYDCLPLIPFGQQCQYARDDECQSTDGKGTNGMCLNKVCVAKNVPIGGLCDVEPTEYTFQYRNSDSQTQTIERDNCTTNTYCDTTGPTKKCVQGLPLGSPCTQDRVCYSGSCNNNGAGGAGVCDQPPDSFRQVAMWVWVVIGVSIIIFMLLTLLGLWLLHRWQSAREHDKIRRFYETQEMFRQQNENALPDTREGSIILGTPIVYNQKNASSVSVPRGAESTPASSSNRLSIQSQNRMSETQFANYSLADETQMTETAGAGGLGIGMSHTTRASSTGSFKNSHPLMNEVGGSGAPSGSRSATASPGGLGTIELRVLSASDLVTASCAH
ncbi:hypothetical protein BC938DRAFT_471369 [Jimgerdemannia flammicorona]|uniref:Uncharacterized protein n=1 Tax=Jimgerdemannia flammicorona TaxID=994334 RepID=A0A433Q892_9FUNG|nr:hypothetical protein BC938DRAFT_471369 [Jimgerdemannia flammicorona]